MENEKDYGLIYVLANQYFKGMVKIGMTRRHDIRYRIKELGTAVPVPFVCVSAYKVPTERLSAIESILHDTYQDKRIGGSEFFAVAPEKVDRLMVEIGNFEPAQEMVQMEIDLDESKRVRKKNMDFFKMGLNPGDTLTYIRNNDITCTIASNKTVDYCDQRGISLSCITKGLLGYAVQPSPFWQTKDGIKLIDLQNGKQEE